MSRKVLKNKPLVEALLEIKWTLATPAPNVRLDPHFKLLLGRLYDRLSHDYPYHEQLPSSILPDEMSAHMVQHRFRHAPDDWPLVQIGPGILTLNETQKYLWDDFRARAINVIRKLYDAHPKTSDLKVESLLLRYIDAVEFDYVSENIFAFLQDKMNVSLVLPASLFEGNTIRKIPSHFSWQSAFQCDNPRGTVTVRFATGQKNDKPALMWETIVQTTNSNLPTLPDGFADWIDAAHAISDDWFFKLIEGELERRFSGD